MRRPLEPREDREVFVVPLTVADTDIDENGHVNNVVYVRWLQDVGTGCAPARTLAIIRLAIMAFPFPLAERA